MDVEHGHQPFHHKKSNSVLVCNGEIYNHQTIRDNSPDFDFSTRSDNEVVIPAYLKHGFKAFNVLDGIFGLVMNVDGVTIAARDPIGIKPLIVGYTKQDNLIWFASEMKCLMDVCDEVEVFPPGHYWTEKTGFVEYYHPNWYDHVGTHHPTSEEIYEIMEQAVAKRMMSDVPLGCFISGGLDSSLAAAYTRKLVGPDAELHSFSVAVEGSNSGDRKYSKMVADHLKTIHHEAVFTVEQGIKVMDKIIYHLESYDPCPLRSGVAMHFLCELAAKYCTVIITGEGADEVWAGYLYLNEASTAEALQKECVTKIRELHSVFVQFDDRLGMASSLELRVPYLDKELLEYAMSLEPGFKLHSGDRIEKHILRAACQDLLPDEVVWRKKEQFGDGVGYSWIDSLKAHFENTVSDSEFERRHELFPYDTPPTKESFYYRSVFEKFFPLASARKLVIRWFPWGDPENHESSGRAQASHQDQEAAAR